MSSPPAPGTPLVAPWPVKMGMVRAMTCAVHDGKPLSGIALRVGWALLDRTNAETGECRWFLSAIHDDLCRFGDTISEDSLRRAVRALEAAGLLRVKVSRDGRSSSVYHWVWDRCLPLRPLPPRKNAPPAEIRPPENIRVPPRNDAPPPPENFRGNIGEKINEQIGEEKHSIPLSPFAGGDDEAGCLLRRLSELMTWTAVGRATKARGIDLSKSVLRQYTLAPASVSPQTVKTIRAASPILQDLLAEEVAKSDPRAEKIVQSFDRIYTEVFGQKRPRPHRDDPNIALQWVEADPAVLDWILSCALKRFRADKGRSPVGLSAIQLSVADGLRAAR